MAPTGLTKDVGWQIGVSRTVPGSLDDVWATLVGQAAVAVWLGELDALPTRKGESYRTAAGVSGELRSFHPRDRVRLTYQPPGRATPTTLQIVVRPGRSRSGPSTVVTFHQERLADAREREAMRAHWAGVAERLEPLLGQDSP
jgi:uncharacterized protein YndB with AHSA1/START domain